MSELNQDLVQYINVEGQGLKPIGVEWSNVTNNPVSGLSAVTEQLVESVSKLDERVTVLEEASGSSHTHTNKEELDKIKNGDVAKWDSAEANAKSYTDTKIAQEVIERNAAIANAKQEAISTSKSYTDGKVATEKSERQASDAALQESINAISGQTGDKLDKSSSPRTIYGVDKDGNQIQYTAGDGISFTDDGQIKCTVSGGTGTVSFGQITGEIAENQKLHSRFTIIEENVSTLDTRLQGAEGTIESLGTRVSAVEGNIYNLSSNKLDKSTEQKTIIYGTDANGNQVKYEAGDNITIANGKISSTGGGTGSANWGSIGGTITDQSDLMGLFHNVSGRVDGIEARVATNEGNISGLQTDVEGLGGRLDSAEGNIGALQSDVQSLSSATINVASELTSHIGNADIHVTAQDKEKWDAAANDAVASAKTYTDEQITALSGVVHSEIEQAILTAEGAASAYTDSKISEEATARIAADEALGTRIDAISGQSHAHANKDVLDAITQEKVDAWDSAEANAKAYADEQVQALSAATVTALDGKQETLVSGTNIKTINGQSILGSGNIEIQGGASGKTYHAGSGITIDAEDNINANTDATTVGEIVIAGGPISAQGIWEDNKIPEGTSVQEILTKLLCKELYPDAATKPSASLGGNSIASYVLVGGKVNLPRIYMTATYGKFNASKYSTPSQPLVQGVQWTNKSVSATINNGFPGLTIEPGEEEIPAMSDVATQLGLNKVTYNGSATYSEPTNMPVTNLNHPTRSTSSVTTASTEYSAVWASGVSRPSKSIQTIGVYPLYTNINEASKTIVEECNIELMKNAATELIISASSEVVVSRHFSVDIPTGRTFSGLFAWNDMAKSWDKQDASAYEVVNDGTIKHTVNGVEYGYMRVNKLGAYQGATVWKFVWDKSLDK